MITNQYSISLTYDLRASSELLIFAFADFFCSCVVMRDCLQYGWEYLSSLLLENSRELVHCRELLSIHFSFHSIVLSRFYFHCTVENSHFFFLFLFILRLLCLSTFLSLFTPLTGSIVHSTRFDRFSIGGNRTPVTSETI